MRQTKKAAAPVTVPITVPITGTIAGPITGPPPTTRRPTRPLMTTHYGTCAIASRLGVVSPMIMTMILARKVIATESVVAGNAERRIFAAAPLMVGCAAKAAAMTIADNR